MNMKNAACNYHCWDLAVSRVAERVKMGGHTVEEQTIRRRYRSGLVNFFDLYSPIADSWQLLDNSNEYQPTIVASKIKNNEIHINLSNTWQKVLEKYNS